MEVKEAVTLAKQKVLELFADEKPANIGLEEVELDDRAGQWVVTVGFSRPWDEPRYSLAALAQSAYPRRSYKIVRIADASGQVVSIKNREEQT